MADAIAVMLWSIAAVFQALTLTESAAVITEDTIQKLLRAQLYGESNNHLPQEVTGDIHESARGMGPYQGIISPFPAELYSPSVNLYRQSQERGLLDYFAPGKTSSEAIKSKSESVAVVSPMAVPYQFAPAPGFYYPGLFPGFGASIIDQAALNKYINSNLNNNGITNSNVNVLNGNGPSQSFSSSQSTMTVCDPDCHVVSSSTEDNTDTGGEKITTSSTATAHSSSEENSSHTVNFHEEEEVDSEGIEFIPDRVHHSEHKTPSSSSSSSDYDRDSDSSSSKVTSSSSSSNSSSSPQSVSSSTSDSSSSKSDELA